MESSQVENSKRIAKNTLLLYIRMVLLILIGLYTSRVNLKVLGVEDFGIYNVIGGTVLMFSVISRSLSSAISRFITFEIGKNDMEKLKIVFSTSINIQIVLSVLIIILVETIGIWFLNNKMVIPDQRMNATFWVFQLSLVSFIFTLLAIPYNAEIIGHERMAAFAYFSIIEAVGRLVIAFGTAYTTYDKLIVFAILQALLALCLRAAYSIYCRINFEECKYQFVFDRSLFKEMTGFASWNFIGTTSALLRDQGGNIVINLFHGPVVNAARGIANQVYFAVYGFVSNFMTALNPQIVKSYATGDRDYMMTLIYQGSRLSYYMLLCISLPLVINVDYVLHLWLGSPPEHASLFVQLAMGFALSESISNPLITASNATGKIRNYQLVVGGIQLLNLPLAYVCLRLGAMPETVLIVAIILGQVSLFVRLYMLRSMIGIKPFEFLRKVYLNVIVVTVISFVVPYFVNSWFETSLINFISVTLLSVVYTLVVIYFIGCNTEERALVLRQVEKIKNKFIK